MRLVGESDCYGQPRFMCRQYLSVGECWTPKGNTRKKVKREEWPKD